MDIKKRETENLKPYQELLERISRRYVQGQVNSHLFLSQIFTTFVTKKYRIYGCKY
jgi:hypothetical protein